MVGWKFWGAIYAERETEGISGANGVYGLGRGKLGFRDLLALGIPFPSFSLSLLSAFADGGGEGGWGKGKGREGKGMGRGKVKREKARCWRGSLSLSIDTHSTQ